MHSYFQALYVASANAFFILKYLFDKRKDRAEAE